MTTFIIPRRGRVSQWFREWVGRMFGADLDVCQMTQSWNCESKPENSEWKPGRIMTVSRPDVDQMNAVYLQRDRALNA